MTTLIEQLNTLFTTAIASVVGDNIAIPTPVIVPASNPKFGDFQYNGALPLAKILGEKPRAIAEKIVAAVDVREICEPLEIAGPGFINLRIKSSYLAHQIQQLQSDPRLGVAKIAQPEKVIVDFSSPNIAKEMHVGHLRSTIIGEAIARLLEFRGYEVLRLNHVGDWGTQFGMLITYLKEVYPDALTQADVLDLGDLVAFYKQAKQRFDQDDRFKEISRQAVVSLQAGDPDSLKAWQLLCEQSRREFQTIYQILDIQLTERGESFYNPFLGQIIEQLTTVGLLQEDQGAKCVFLEGFSNKDGNPLPLIVQKSDGGYNYATTDLAALQYRIQSDRAQTIIYVTDAGQANHFAQVFQVAKKAGILPENVTVIHVPFGLVKGEDGKKLKTRSGETIRLKDLLEEAVNHARRDLEQRIQEEDRTETTEFIAHVAQTVGIAAVKYADLSQNRTSDYVFSFDKMLALQGNTAPYMLYAYARIKSIGREGGIDLAQWGEKATIQLTEISEQGLAKTLLQFPEVIKEVENHLLPNRLCEYLYELSKKFNQFYENCPVLKAEDNVKISRLTLCDLTARTLALGLSLLGIPLLERM